MTTETRYMLGAYDRPVVRDWAFWWSVAIAVLFFYTSFYPASAVAPSGAPRGLDALFAGIVGFWIMGYPLALARRGVRALRARSRPSSTALDPPAHWLRLDQDEEPSQSPPHVGWPRPTGPPSVAPPPPSKPMGLPVPLSAANIPGGPEASGAVEKARTSLPYPIARAARALHVNQDPLEQHRLILDLGEAISDSVGALAAAWLREYSPADPALKVLHESFHRGGVSQGHWHEVIAASQRAMLQDQAHALPGFLTGVSRSAKQPGLLADLKTLVEERNQTAHGARPHTRSEAAVRVSEFIPVVERALGRLSFMAKLPWLLVEGVAYRRDDRKFIVQTGIAMTDHPEFESRTMVLSSPLANDTFYVLVEQTQVTLDLTPFLVIRYCETCHQPEVFFADRVVEKRGVSLKSVGRGHQMYDPGLVSEFDSLLGLRRDADESRG